VPKSIFFLILILKQFLPFKTKLTEIIFKINKITATLLQLNIAIFLTKL